MNRLIVASANKGKIREIKELLGDRYEIISMADAGINIDIEETGATFEENAAIKAKAIFALCGCPVISDDSGLIVDALNGEPGVYSARYAGNEHDDEKNNQKLLAKLKDKTDRSARFVSAVVYYDGKTLISAEGRVEGKILTEKKGDNGFGYDPLFYSTELKKSFGEASAEEKNSVSHRARAFKSLMEKL
ncbi:MAG: XTP/dITP diphosphatase [Christensenellales bacterium]